MWRYLCNLFVAVSIIAIKFGKLYERFRGQELRYLMSNILDLEFSAVGGTLRVRRRDLSIGKVKF